MLTLVVLISGGGSILRAILDAAAGSDFPARVVAVGADDDCPGLLHAEQFGIPSFTVAPTSFESRTEWGEELLRQIQSWTPDLVVCAGFMRVLPPVVVQTLSPRIINTHPALLPRFPGAHAVRDALAADAVLTGATVHVIDEGVDTGPVLAQAEVAVLPDDTEATLHERIKVVERDLVVRTIRDIADRRIQLDDYRGNSTR